MIIEIGINAMVSRRLRRYSVSVGVSA